MVVKTFPSEPESDVIYRMDEIGTVHNPTLGTEPTQSGATRLGLDPAFQLVPFLSLLAFLAIRDVYPLLDGKPCYWIAIGLCIAGLSLISGAQQRSKAGKNIRSFFPITTWLAFGPVILAGILLLNGMLDHSQVEQHHQLVVDKRISRGRLSSTTYYLDVTSWRANQSTEELEVSGLIYGQFRVEDPVTIELHKGALALPWVARIR